MNEQILPIPAFQDNYLWLMVDGRGHAAIVDPGDAAPVQAFLQAHQLQLSAILVTHHHADHIGGVATLQQATGATVYAPKDIALPHVDVVCQHGDSITVLGQTLDVLAVPAHTLDHIAYTGHVFGMPRLFCGDTLFSCGCGRLFEGTARQLYAALQLFSDLDDDTLVYCAHEYTTANIRFALQVEPDNPALKDYQQHVSALRTKNTPSLPSTIGLEKQVNPFMRCHLDNIQETVRTHADKQLDSEISVLAALRTWKDTA